MSLSENEATKPAEKSSFHENSPVRASQTQAVNPAEIGADDVTAAFWGQDIEAGPFRLRVIAPQCCPSVRFILIGSCNKCNIMFYKGFSGSETSDLDLTRFKQNSWFSPPFSYNLPVHKLQLHLHLPEGHFGRLRDIDEWPADT